MILTLLKVWVQREEIILPAVLRPQQNRAVERHTPVAELVTRIVRISENIKPLIEGDSYWALCKAGWCIVIKVIWSQS
jgi:hypothetical protein